VSAWVQFEHGLASFCPFVKLGVLQVDTFAAFSGPFCAGLRVWLNHALAAAPRCQGRYGGQTSSPAALAASHSSRSKVASVIGCPICSCQTLAHAKWTVS